MSYRGIQYTPVDCNIPVLLGRNYSRIDKTGKLLKLPVFSASIPLDIFPSKVPFKSDLKPFRASFRQEMENGKTF